MTRAGHAVLGTGIVVQLAAMVLATGVAILVLLRRDRAA